MEHIGICNRLNNKWGDKVNEREVDLIKKSQKGDIDAFEELIKDYKKIAYNIALRVMKNKENAEDASQEALIKVYKNIKNFNQKSTFKVWLYRIVMNSCIDLQRKNKHEVTSLDSLKKGKDNDYKVEIEDTSKGPDAILETKLNNEILYKCIDSLADDHKQIIILRDLQELSYKEISDVLNCSEGTVKSRLSRARTKLKKNLLDIM